jgi:hypothetical protein
MCGLGGGFVEEPGGAAGADLWQGYCLALPLYDPRCEKDGPLYGPHRSPDGREEIDTLVATWRERDPLARHFGLPWTE